jgi:hypothetical protein
MKQKIKLITFITFCSIFIVSVLYAGSDAYNNCDKCHYYSNGQRIAQPDPFLNAIHKNQLTKK